MCKYHSATKMIGPNMYSEAAGVCKVVYQPGQRHLCFEQYTQSGARPGWLSDDKLDVVSGVPTIDTDCVVCCHLKQTNQHHVCAGGMRLLCSAECDATHSTPPAARLLPPSAFADVQPDTVYRALCDVTNREYTVAECVKEDAAVEHVPGARCSLQGVVWYEHVCAGKQVKSCMRSGQQSDRWRGTIAAVAVTACKPAIVDCTLLWAHGVQ